MKQNLKNLALVIGVTSLLVMLMGAGSNILFAQGDDVEETEIYDETCGTADCGDINADENATGGGCTMDRWTCDGWSTCSAENSQTRTCSLAFNCPGVVTPKPAEKQTCKYVPPPPVCTEDTWSCDPWSVCSADGSQTRTCKLANDCKEVSTPSPAVKQVCTPPPPACTKDTWTCGEWSACSASGSQTRECKMTYDCKEANTPSPAIKQACTPPPICIMDEWTCGEWSACSENSVQKRTCKLTGDCVTANTSSPTTEQKCEYLPPVPKCTTDIWECENWETCSPNDTQTRTCGLAYDCEYDNSTPPATVGSCDYQEPPQFVCFESSDNDRDGIPCPSDPDDLNPDMNGNGILDGLERNSTGSDPEDNQMRADQQAEIQTLVGGGMASQEAYEVVRKTYKKQRTLRQRTKIRENYELTYKRKIEFNTDDDDKDGISNEVAIALKVNPNYVELNPELPSLAEMKIYSSNPQLFGKKCTTNIYSGYKLPADGFTVLAACPKDKLFTLYAIDKKGRQVALETRKSSENGKIVFAIEKNFLPGRYLFQVKSSERMAYVQTDTLNGGREIVSVDSDPVLVEIVGKTTLPKPIVTSIEGLDVSDLRDIQVEATEDGRIRVSGISDASSMVVGTFQSAVFTSALFADIENGKFEVVSQKPLELGDHEVVIYATRPEESIQSEPVRLKFRIINVAQAASVGEVRPVATEQKQFPLDVVTVLGGLAIIAVVTGLYVGKRSH